MADRDVALLFDGGGFFEGPRWRDGTWWVSDFYRHTVSRIAPDGTETVVVEVEHQPSGLGWLPDGSMIISSMKDHKVLRFADGELTVLADLDGLVGGHINDLITDANGHTYVGNFGFDLMSGAKPEAADLIRVDPDGTVTVAASGLYFPNGAVITPDGSTLIIGETTGNRYSAYTIAGDGSLTDHRYWAEFAPELVSPDGCSLDADGHIWVADASGNRCVRVAPGGAIVEEVRVPGDLGIYACQLGGDDGRTLLMCAAPDFFEHTRSAAREAALFTTQVDVAHAGLP